MTPAVDSQAEGRRMWPGGPLRLWSEAQISTHWLKHDSGGYYGPYSCEHCRKPSDGVYAAPAKAQAARKWVCGRCLLAARPGSSPRTTT